MVVLSCISPTFLSWHVCIFALRSLPRAINPAAVDSTSSLGHVANHACHVSHSSYYAKGLSMAPRSILSPLQTAILISIPVPASRVILLCDLWRQAKIETFRKLHSLILKRAEMLSRKPKGDAGHQGPAEAAQSLRLRVERTARDVEEASKVHDPQVLGSFGPLCSFAYLQLRLRWPLPGEGGCV